MAEASRIHDWRARLLAELAEIEAGDALGAEDRQTVTLDQQSVGRLSRMDALQRQAMAEANRRRRDARRLRIKAALTRIEDDEFGYCEDCGDEIPPARLDLDPTVPKCLSCANG